MEVRMDSRTGAVLTGIDPVVTQIQQRLQARPKEWLRALRKDFGKLADVEKEIHQAFSQMADQVVAGLLAEATAGDDFAEAAKKKVSAADPERKRRRGEARPLRLRLFGGLLLWVTTLYCSPKLRTGKKRGREGAGLYPEWGLLGIQEGKSPALVREVGRLTALLPSYEAVQHELAERGTKLDIKEVHGIGRYAAQASLTLRRRELERYRQGHRGGRVGRRGGVDRDRLFGASRRGGPHGLCQFSPPQTAGGQRRDRERDPTGDQFAHEGKQHLLERRERRRHACSPRPGAESPLAGDVYQDQRQHVRGPPPELALASARHGRSAEGGHRDCAADAPNRDAVSWLRRSCMTPKWEGTPYKNTVSAATGGPWTPRFANLFKRAGLSLDDEINLVRVPGHYGPHSEQYHRIVYQRLRMSLTNAPD